MQKYKPANENPVFVDPLFVGPENDVRPLLENDGCPLFVCPLLENDGCPLFVCPLLENDGCPLFVCPLLENDGCPLFVCPPFVRPLLENPPNENGDPLFDVLDDPKKPNCKHEHNVIYIR